jgi:hypothetical protein
MEVKSYDFSVDWGPFPHTQVWDCDLTFFLSNGQSWCAVYPKEAMGIVTEKGMQAAFDHLHRIGGLRLHRLTGPT